MTRRDFLSQVGARVFPKTQRFCIIKCEGGDGGGSDDARARARAEYETRGGNDNGLLCRLPAGNRTSPVSHTEHGDGDGDGGVRFSAQPRTYRNRSRSTLARSRRLKSSRRYERKDSQRVAGCCPSCSAARNFRGHNFAGARGRQPEVDKPSTVERSRRGVCVPGAHTGTRTLRLADDFAVCARAH